MLPVRFLIYRDGLSEGEIQNVCKGEIDDIRGQFCARIMAYVMVDI